MPQTGRLYQNSKRNQRCQYGHSRRLKLLVRESKKLGDSFQILLLQHHLIGSANQVIYFMRQENGNFSKWKGAECARQWGRVETIWKPIRLDDIDMQISKEARYHAKTSKSRLPKESR